MEGSRVGPGRAALSSRRVSCWLKGQGAVPQYRQMHTATDAGWDARRQGHGQDFLSGTKTDRLLDQLYRIYFTTQQKFSRNFHGQIWTEALKWVSQ